MKKALFALLMLCAASLVQSAEEIRLWHSLTGTVGVELDRLIARFNASQSQYRVVSFLQGPYDAVMADDLAVRRGSANAPHLVQVQDTATADILRSGAARPLWRVMEEHGQSQPRYLAAAAAYFSDGDGRLLALPFNISTPVLYINRDAMREAKLDPSKPPRTWYETPAVLGRLVESGRRCALTTTLPSWVLMETMSAWHNQAFATHHNGMAEGPARLVFNTRLMVRWIAMLSSWQKSGYFSYSGREDEAEARFASGECALLTASSASLYRLRDAAQFEFGVAELPYYDDYDGAPQNTLVGGSGLWVVDGFPQAQYRGVARFIAYLSSLDVQAFWHQRTGFLPITEPAYELSRRQGYYRGHPEQEVAVRQLLRKPPTAESRGVRLGGLRRIRGIIHEELEAVWSGAKPPMEALDTAVRRGNLLLEAIAASRSPR